jgi:hypothetical protein
MAVDENPADKMARCRRVMQLPFIKSGGFGLNPSFVRQRLVQ